jgi:hypothetical protein
MQMERVEGHCDRDTFTATELMFVIVDGQMGRKDSISMARHWSADDMLRSLAVHRRHPSPSAAQSPGTLAHITHAPILTLGSATLQAHNKKVCHATKPINEGMYRVNVNSH